MKTSNQKIEQGANTVEEFPINLFWTGGWDSTFRLIFLILVEKRSVQPYYIIDKDRPSTDFELKAMESIREELIRKYPKTEKKLLPIIWGHKEKIKPNSFITENFCKIDSQICRLGSQYDWLSRYAIQEDLNDLEICHEKKLAPSDFDKVLFPELFGEGHGRRVKESPSKKEMIIFKYFRYPVAHLTKLDMEELAKKHNFFEILTKTWFCHTPKKNGDPCEVCRPCLLARKSGHTHGLPKTNYLRDIWVKVSSSVTHIFQTIQKKISRFF